MAQNDEAKHALQKIREILEVSITELADLSGISVSSIRRIESGDTTFKINEATAESLTAALGVRMFEAFSGMELSHLGRPPHTGKKLDNGDITHLETTCPHCRLITSNQLPNCVQCERPLGLPTD